MNSIELRVADSSPLNVSLVEYDEIFLIVSLDLSKVCIERGWIWKLSLFLLVNTQFERAFAKNL